MQVLFSKYLENKDGERVKKSQQATSGQYCLLWRVCYFAFNDLKYSSTSDL
jgi:hypothetical protein